ncbi:MAG: D-alanyl-D-alanine carboxypeptidase/D-alanyl-D-alanine-endopeptidase [Francisellaceae bacterium]|jgi:serine-type D-Ala-D-Ala carboxypeptidase/endopeptidase (penicillin-binding protein 4)|nr:D-alanyl-D-alanine carboxypeptidase/D-alanyl-D-alanine-endopeptidase [Francisellaceae bacterium]MBT6538461.1 D-alanyl-D-alanine carboxypeptidase/D-alanyl-D-alanine-endopeptidase [Francisellaceae bacterium]
MIKVLGLIIAVFSASIASATSYENLEGKIDKLIENRLPRASVGVLIQDAESGETIYSKNADQLFIPASTLKLFTSAAALQQLGPDFCFETQLKIKSSSKSVPVLNNTVYLKFSGDPSFSEKNLDDLLNTFVKAGIKEINGDFILDETLYEGPKWGRGWIIEDTYWYFSPPITAAILNENYVGVSINPSKTLGQPTIIKFDKPQIDMKISSNVKTVTYKESEEECQLDILLNANNNLHFKGCWAVSNKPYQGRVAIQDPISHIKNLIIIKLRELGIKIKGQVKSGKTPANSFILAIHKSENLTSLLPKILGNSNNLYAESLFKTIGAEVYGRGSFQTGTLAVKKILSKYNGLDVESLHFVDGSGLSRYNLITPGHLSRVLFTMYNDTELGGHFSQALAMSGVKGSLRNRLHSFDTIKKIKAKTGTMSGVSGIAGFLNTRKGQSLIVVVLINQSIQSHQTRVNLEDEILYLVSS